MKKLIGFLLSTMLLFACTDKKAADTSTSTTDSTSNTAKDQEIGDPKYTDIGKKVMASLASGDMDTWMNAYADNAVFRWSNGDSLSGKAAISDYWRKRRAEVIDSLSFTHEIWLPMKVNNPQAASQWPGNYILTWHMVYARYTNGKSMQQRSHLVFHFNDKDQIDRVTQYIDRSIINAATAK